MTAGRVEAIGFEDKTNRASYKSQVKKKNPWDNIGAAMTGFGSMVNNLPDKFNSAFTVGQGTSVQGAFGD